MFVAGDREDSLVTLPSPPLLRIAIPRACLFFFVRLGGAHAAGLDLVALVGAGVSSEARPKKLSE